MLPASSTLLRRIVLALLLPMLAATLLTLSGAPFGQWYLAWLGLAPWLVAVAEAPRAGGAIVRGFIGGACYFALNMWWLWTASIPGTLALIAYFSLYWAAAAATIHALGLLAPVAGLAPSAPQGRSGIGSRLGSSGSAVGIAVVWVAFEWLRCNLISGAPWLPLGVTQTPIVAMCQVADLGGPWIVSAWVALINALVAMAWLRRDRLPSLAPAAGIVALLLATTALYGGVRLLTTATTPGPRVMMLQSDFRHLPGGAPTAAPEEIVAFFLAQLQTELKAEPIDLALLPEAAFPPINAEARSALARAPVGSFLDATYSQLVALGQQSGASLLVGGNAVTGWTREGTTRVGSQIHNAAYYFPSDSAEVDQRYDKIHLVPFSERAPFANGPAWMRQAGLAIAAARASQPLTPGDVRSFKPFTLAWRQPDGSHGALRFVSPICLEAIDPRVVRRMMDGPDAKGKYVDLIANLSNDGWFDVQEKHQHLQLLAFRCIEHRVPLVRCSNTGISGWIDSTGRIRDTIAANATGAAIAQVELDGRTTFYWRYGDVFAAICLGMTAVGIALQGALTLRP